MIKNLGGFWKAVEKKRKSLFLFLMMKKKGKTRGSQEEEKLVEKSWCKYI